MDTDQLSENDASGAIEAWIAHFPLEAMADAWWRYTMRWDAAYDAGEETPNSNSDPDGWAEQVWQSELLMRSEETVRKFLRIAADRAPQESSSDDGPLSYLGAGPIEDFLDADLDRLLWIEKTAKGSRAFREALRGVYDSCWPSQPQWVQIEGEPGKLERRTLEVDPLIAEAVERIKNLP